MTIHQPLATSALCYVAVALIVAAILSLCDPAVWINAVLDKLAGAL